MRVDLHRARFSLLQVFCGSVLAAVVALAGVATLTSLSATTSCRASNFAPAADMSAKAKPFFSLGPVADPLVQLYLNGLAERAAELKAEQDRINAEAVARGEQPTPEKKMGLEQWLYIIGGVGAAAGTFVASKQAAKTKATETVQANNIVRDVAQDNLLGELGVGIAAAVAAAKKNADPAVVTNILSDHLPREVMVHQGEVAAALDKVGLTAEGKPA